jgi:hypothetical protein
MGMFGQINALTFFVSTDHVPTKRGRTCDVYMVRPGYCMAMLGAGNDEDSRVVAPFRESLLARKQYTSEEWREFTHPSEYMIHWRMDLWHSLSQYVDFALPQDTSCFFK